VVLNEIEKRGYKKATPIVTNNEIPIKRSGYLCEHHQDKQPLDGIRDISAQILSIGMENLKPPCRKSAYKHIENAK